MSKLKELLAENIQKALDTMKELFVQDNYLYNDIILQTGRWSSLQQKRTNGLILESSSTMEENKIRYALNELIDRYEREYGPYTPPGNSEKPSPATPGNGGAAIQGKMNILFLAANPKNEIRLQVDKEYRKIDERLKMSTHRTYQLEQPQFSVTIEGMLQAFSQTQPEIVHFAGHGEKAGIFITNEANESLLVPNNALKRLFRQYKDTVQVVVLSACYSEAQAQIISELGIYVVGMSDEIADEAAIVFSTGFYLGLGENQPVEQAFTTALITLETKFPNEANLPVLWKDGAKIEI